MRRDDDIDLLWRKWAPQRSKILGIILPCKPTDYLGPQCSIAGKMQRDAAGAAYTALRQTFPEVYTGDAWYVNQAWQRLDELKRAVADLRYCFSGPVKAKAFQLRISERHFWYQLGLCKQFLRGWLISGNCSTNTPEPRFSGDSVAFLRRVM